LCGLVIRAHWVIGVVARIACRRLVRLRPARRCRTRAMATVRLGSTGVGGIA
jgi:hypothetical protein